MGFGIGYYELANILNVLSTESKRVVVSPARFQVPRHKTILQEVIQQSVQCSSVSGLCINFYLAATRPILGLIKKCVNDFIFLPFLGVFWGVDSVSFSIVLVTHSLPFLAFFWDDLQLLLEHFSG